MWALFLAGALGFFTGFGYLALAVFERDYRRSSNTRASGPNDPHACPAVPVRERW